MRRAIDVVNRTKWFILSGAFAFALLSLWQFNEKEGPINEYVPVFLTPIIPTVIVTSLVVFLSCIFAQIYKTTVGQGIITFLFMSLMSVCVYPGLARSWIKQDILTTFQISPLSADILMFSPIIGICVLLFLVDRFLTKFK